MSLSGSDNTNSTTRGTNSEIARFFQENGYYHAKGIFNTTQIALLELEFDSIISQLNHSGEPIDATWDGSETKKLADSNDSILHTHNVQKYSRVWLDAFLYPSFLDIASQILGDDIVLHHSKLFQKPAENGSPFPMHQDWTYFPTELDSMIAGVVHVSNATDDMGCLRVYPGSHHLGRIEGSNGRQHNDVLDEYPIEQATVLEATAGDVVFFHYLTLHGSMPNRSKDLRKTVLCQLHAGHDQVEASNQHPNEKLVLKGRNRTLTRLNAS